MAKTLRKIERFGEYRPPSDENKFSFITRYCSMSIRKFNMLWVTNKIS